jgi:ribosome maturation factor RimP
MLRVSVTNVQLKERISELVQETAARLGCMVYESSVLFKGENSQIHVKIDSLAGVSHKDCENFSRELSAQIDNDNILPNYSLEVSSPGLNRLLRSGEEFRRFVGAPVKVVYDEGAERRVAKGTIESADVSAVTVATDRGPTTILYDTITSANLDY